MLKKKKVDARTLDARTLDARTLDARTLDARSTLVAVGYMKGGLLDRRTLDSAAQCRRREMRLARLICWSAARARWPPRLSVRRCEAGELLAVRVPALGGAIVVAQYPKATQRNAGRLQVCKNLATRALAKDISLTRYIMRAASSERWYFRSARRVFSRTRPINEPRPVT